MEPSSLLPLVGIGPVDYVLIVPIPDSSRCLGTDILLNMLGFEQRNCSFILRYRLSPIIAARSFAFSKNPSPLLSLILCLIESASLVLYDVMANGDVGAEDCYTNLSALEM